MTKIFVSFDSRDRNMAKAVVERLRQTNPAHDFFWSGDSMSIGKGWFRQIERKLAEAHGIIGLITNNQSWSRDWINFEVGGASAGEKKRLVVIGSGVSVAAQAGTPLSHIQCVNYSDKGALKRGLKGLGLSDANSDLATLMREFEEPLVLKCKYGERDHWHEYTVQERGDFVATLRAQQWIQVGNHLIGNHDPSPTFPKTLKLTLERAGKTYTRSVAETRIMQRGELW